MRSLSLFLIILLVAPAAWAGPWLDPGDSALRHDVQVLADAGVISGPVSTWPLATGDILSALEADPAALEPAARAALSRLRERLETETAVGRVRMSAHVSATQHPRDIRGFEDGPRESGEVGAGLEWTGERFAARVQGQWVNDPDDNKDLRLDGS